MDPSERADDGVKAKAILSGLLNIAAVYGCVASLISCAYVKNMFSVLGWSSSTCFNTWPFLFCFLG